MFRETPRVDQREPTREGVLRAADKVAAILPPTPLLPFEIDSVRLWAKCENLQPIGAFKVRGAWHKLTDLTDEEKARGVVAVSSGTNTVRKERGKPGQAIQSWCSP